MRNDETQKRVFRIEKRNRCFFVTNASRHPISLPTRQNMFSIRKRVKSTVYVGKAASQEHNAENNVT